MYEPIIPLWIRLCYRCNFKQRFVNMRLNLDKIEETRKFAAQGLTYSQIAIAMGELYDTIRERCKNHQITVTNKKPRSSLNPDHKEKLAKGLALLETGMTITEAASQSGVNFQTLYYHARNYREKRRKENTKQPTTNKPTAKAGFNTFQLLNDVFNSNPIIRNPNRLPAW